MTTRSAGFCSSSAENQGSSPSFSTAGCALSTRPRTGPGPGRRALILALALLAILGSAALSEAQSLIIFFKGWRMSSGDNERTGMDELAARFVPGMGSDPAQGSLVGVRVFEENARVGDVADFIKKRTSALNSLTVRSAILGFAIACIPFHLELLAARLALRPRQAREAQRNRRHPRAGDRGRLRRRRRDWQGRGGRQRVCAGGVPAARSSARAALRMFGMA